MAAQPAPMVTTHEGGKRFATMIRGHTLVTDQPVAAGGEDAGPTPLELLGAALGGCVALYVQQFCLTRGIPHEGMRVEVMQHKVLAPARIGRFEVRIVLAAEPPAQQLEMLERVARSCPVHNTLHQCAEIEVTITRLVAA